MVSLASGLILLGVCVSLGQSLVHFMQLASGGKKGGCIDKSGNHIPVGGSEKDPNTCGVYVCQNDDGVALIHYCQQTASFQECDEEGVSTVLPFPECCWICVEFADCDDDDDEEDDGDDEEDGGDDGDDAGDDAGDDGDEGGKKAEGDNEAKGDNEAEEGNKAEGDIEEGPRGWR